MKKSFLLIASFFLLSQTAANAGQIVAATSDYETGNTAVYDTKTGVLNGNALGHADQDIIVDSDGKYVYFISRSQGAVSKYSPSAIDGEHLIYQYSVGAEANPYDIVFLDTKAYVINYSMQEITVIDQNAANLDSFITGSIDISGFDPNGVPEAAYGFEYEGMAYIVLQRLNGWTADSQGYLLKIDSATDTIVDLDDTEDGVQGMELLVKNPQYFSQAGGVAYIGGHVWGAQTEGVETVDLVSPGLTQTMLLSESVMQTDITGLNVLNGEYGLYYSSSWLQDSEGVWYQTGTASWFDPSDGTPGQVLPVPTPEGGAVMVDGIAYVGSRDDGAPGIYAVDPASNTLSGSPLLTTLPPTSIVYVDDTITAVENETESSPEAFAIGAPYPNPFNPSTAIAFTLADPGMTKAEVFNVGGQKIATLANGVFPAGMHRIRWNPENCSAGAYFIRVQHNGMTKSAKVMLVK